MHFIKNQKGSTLMLLVITVAILSMLGTALLAMSLMNVNMKSNDYRIKKSQYYAESGMDQVYALVGKKVADVIDVAISDTDVQVNQLILTVNTYLALPNPEAAANWSTEALPYVKKTDSNAYILDLEAVEAKANSIYITEFKAGMNAEAASLEDEIISGDVALGHTQYVDINMDASGTSSLKVYFDPTGGIDQFQTTPGSLFRIRDIVVEYKDVTGTLKKIKTDIVVSDEVKNFPISAVENRIIVPDNPLWKKAIVSNGNLIFDNADVTVDGEVYGYGQMPSGAISTTEGIRVEGSDADVIINGNVYSRAYVQVRDGSANLTVNNGLVYANSVVTDKTASGSRLNVKGAVYTQDDLELNGPGSKINIDGSYFGYTDGSSVGAASSHDKSSAIIINEDMDTESLTITGNRISLLDYQETMGVSEVLGAMIGGTAYISNAVSNADRYQTAESVSIKKNYIAYTWKFAASDLLGLKNNPVGSDEGFFVDDRYDFFADAVTRDSEVDRIFVTELVFDDLVGASGIKVAKPNNIKDRKVYFAAFDMLVDPTNTFLNTKNIDIRKYIYATGLQIYNNEYADNQRMAYSVDGSTTASFGSYQFGYLSDKIIADYIYQLNQLGHSNSVEPLLEVDPVNGIKAHTDDLSGDLNPDYIGATNHLNNLNIVHKYSNIEESTMFARTIQKPAHQNGVSWYSGNTVEQIKFINMNAADSYAIVGPNAGSIPASYSADKIITHGGRMQGIIISNGNLEFFGDLDFAGPIISSGDITFNRGSVHLINQGDDINKGLIDLINKDAETDLYDMFDVSKYSTTSPASDTVTLEEIEKIEIHDGSLADATAVNSIFDYRDIVFFDHWKIEE